MGYFVCFALVGGFYGYFALFCVGQWLVWLFCFVLLWSVACMVILLCFVLVGSLYG